MNIPLIDILNIIKNHATNDDQFISKTTITRNNILGLVNLVLTTTWYTFSCQFHQQTDAITIRR